MGRRGLFVVAALGAGYYLGAQTLQELLYRFAIPEDPAPAQALLLRQSGADRLRALVMLGSFLAMVPVYAAVAVDRFRRAPGAAVCGFAFGLLFVLFEISYRSLDLFLVGDVWAGQYAAGDETALARALMWDQAVAAWYKPLIAVHLCSSLAFVAAFRRPEDRGDWLAVAAFGLNAARLGLRLGGSELLAGGLYYPPVAIITALLVVWLVRRARAT